VESDTEETHAPRKSLKQSEENDAPSASKLNFKFIYRIYFSDSFPSANIETSQEGWHDVIQVFFFLHPLYS
jgi:hypothetical protein